MRASPSALASIAVASLAALVAPSAAGAATTAEVDVADFRFSPAFTRVEPGDSVRWSVRGSGHTVTSRAGAPERFDSGDLFSGQEFVRAFPTAGRYPYHCTIHAEMRGVVQVGPDTTPPTAKRVKLTLGAKSARVSFRISETAKSRLLVRRASKPRRVVRRGKARQLHDGARSLTVKTSGLAAGRYRIDVEAIDAEGNAGVTRAGAFKIASDA